MSAIQELKEIVALLRNPLTRMWHWSAKSERNILIGLGVYALLMYALFASLSMASILGWEEATKETIKEQRLAHQALGYQTVVDWANLCVKGSAANRKNALWYCARATELYKRYAQEELASVRNEVIDRKAYGAMIVNMKGDLRLIENKLESDDADDTWRVLFRYVFSDWGRSLTVLVVALSIIAVLAGLRRTHHQYYKEHHI